MLAAGAALLVSRRAMAETQGGPWAVELFTSQGCSSCPPADLNLGKLAARPDIVALSFHVNYWDYIGWKDLFASKESTDRQRVYARTLRQRYVYTPEMVVDGRAHGPGINESAIEGLLAVARRQSVKRATPDLQRIGAGALTIGLAGTKLDQPADVVVFAYDRHHSTPVGRGENGGRRLENFNVVRHFEVVSRWDGAARQWTVPANRFQAGQGIAVIVQQADQGPVLGANKLELPAAG
ncbi:MAG: DUF1223 domain-containing protein [Enhydrobacter sp.]|nr:DUF1223 domain-containing protein [Enhydrobacter sp.]